MPWPAVLAIALAAAALSALGVYGALYFRHRRHIRREFDIKARYNELTALAIKNSKKLVQRLARGDESFKDSALLLEIVDESLDTMTNELKDAITALERMNVEGDYAASAKYARKIFKTLSLSLATMREFADVGAAAASHNDVIDGVRVTYMTHYERALAAYENELIAKGDSRKIEDAKNLCSTTNESLKAAKFTGNPNELFDQITHFDDAVKNFCSLVYKLPKLHYLCDQHVPARIKATEKAAIDAKRARLITDFTVVDSKLSFVKKSLAAAEKHLKAMLMDECEQSLTAALTELDGADGYLLLHVNASSLLNARGDGLAAAVAHTVSRAPDVLALLKDLESGTGPNDAVRVQAEAANRSLLNLRADFASVKRRDDARELSSIELARELYGLANRLLETKGRLEALAAVTAERLDLYVKAGIELANFRLSALSVERELEGRSELLISKLQPTALWLTAHLRDLERRLAEDQISASDLRHEMKSAQELLDSLYVQLQAGKVVESIAESLIVYANRYRNEHPDIKKAIAAAEEAVGDGSHDQAVLALTPVVEKIKASARESGLKMS